MSVVPACRGDVGLSAAKHAGCCLLRWPFVVDVFLCRCQMPTCKASRRRTRHLRQLPAKLNDLPAETRSDILNKLRTLVLCQNRLPYYRHLLEMYCVKQAYHNVLEERLFSRWVFSVRWSVSVQDYSKRCQPMFVKFCQSKLLNLRWLKCLLAVWVSCNRTTTVDMKCDLLSTYYFQYRSLI